MGLLDILFGQVSRTINNHSSPNTPGPVYDPSDLLGQLSGVFGQHASSNNEDFQSGQGQGDYGNVRPASEDPHGDPADQPGGGQFGNVRPASEDPYGDPADQR